MGTSDELVFHRGTLSKACTSLFRYLLAKLLALRDHQLRSSPLDIGIGHGLTSLRDLLVRISLDERYGTCAGCRLTTSHIQDGTSFSARAGIDALVEVKVEGGEFPILS